MRVVRALAPNPGPFTLEGTNTWIVGAPPSVVIDPGPDDPGHREAILAAAKEVGVILLTHQHPDHAPGAARLAALTNTRVYAFRPQNDERLLRDRQTIVVGEVKLRAVHTPGHSSDHLAFWLEERAYLFTGDAVLGRGTSVVNPPDGDMIGYISSLRAMRELGPRILYPGHGPIVFDGAAKLEEYIRHRELRERQVLKALEEGKATPAEMVPGIYGTEIPESMFPAAERSLLAHLLKLEREGKISRTGPTGSGRFALVPARKCERCGRRAAPGSRFCDIHALAQLQEGL